MKDVYVYPAVFYKQSNEVWVKFIDFACYTATKDGEEPTCENAMEQAKEALAFHLMGMLEDGDEIPEPTPLDKIDPKETEGGAVALVEVVMPLYLSKFETVNERTNVTIPKWLKKHAEKKKVNFSKVLTDGLLETLGLSKRS